MGALREDTMIKSVGVPDPCSRQYIFDLFRVAQLEIHAYVMASATVMLAADQGPPRVVEFTDDADVENDSDAQGALCPNN